jgi:hypothetical protein
VDVVDESAVFTPPKQTSHYVETFGLAPVAVGIFAAGIIVFFGVLTYPPTGRREGTALTDPAMRNAIAASLIVVFSGVLVLGVFHTTLPGEDTNPDTTTIGEQIASELVTAFGLVVGFYFPSSVAAEWLKYRESQMTIRAGKNPDQGADPTQSQSSGAGGAAAGGTAGGTP